VDRRKERDVDKHDVTPWERFVDATKRVLSVPKADLDKAVQEQRSRKKSKKRRRKSS
jgi:hypothetical protein